MTGVIGEREQRTHPGLDSGHAVLGIGVVLDEHDQPPGQRRDGGRDRLLGDLAIVGTVDLIDRPLGNGVGSLGGGVGHIPAELRCVRISPDVAIQILTGALDPPLICAPLKHRR